MKLTSENFAFDFWIYGPSQRQWIVFLKGIKELEEGSEHRTNNEKYWRRKTKFISCYFHFGRWGLILVTVLRCSLMPGSHGICDVHARRYIDCAPKQIAFAALPIPPIPRTMNSDVEIDDVRVWMENKPIDSVRLPICSVKEHSVQN